MVDLENQRQNLWPKAELVLSWRAEIWKRLKTQEVSIA